MKLQLTKQEARKIYRTLVWANFATSDSHVEKAILENAIDKIRYAMENPVESVELEVEIDRMP